MTQSPKDFDVRTEIPEAPSPVPIPLPLNVHNALAQHTSPSQAQHPNACNAPDRNNLGLARGDQAAQALCAAKY